MFYHSYTNINKNNHKYSNIYDFLYIESSV